MNVKVAVKVDNAKINKLIESHKKALELTAEAVKSDIETSQVVPKDTGTLEDSGFVDLSQIQNAVAKVVYDTPYARKIYWHPEYNFRKDKNPNAQGKWMDSYLYGSKKNFIKETYAKFFKMLSKGLIH